MNKRFWKALALHSSALGVALCSAFGAMAHQNTRAMPTPPIDVEVADGRVLLAATSVRTGTGQVTLSWRLLTPGYRFTNDSINFLEASEYFSCTTYNYGLGIRCTKSADAPTGRIRYTVQVGSGGAGAVQESDPNIWINND